MPITLQNSPFWLSLALALTNSVEAIVAPVVLRPMDDEGMERPLKAAQASATSREANLGLQAVSCAYVVTLNRSATNDIRLM